MSRNNRFTGNGEDPAEPWLGPLGVGTLVGAVVLYGLYVGGPIIFSAVQTTADPTQPVRYLSGPVVLIPIAGYLAIAILLAVRPPTAKWGAGLLIGLGIFTLLGGGICVGYLAQIRA
ncbi:hypothetical protein ASF72_01245 [Arthrobacter sp. Leaf141]|uniref:hypothetical protein n=1 Tax=Micrococcaceae TaxID=1268 RepID=UPI0006F5151D|nr:MULTISPECIES: hypothetical protein [Micrococcaceae]KQQ98801.1 hypothetical protein ASF72_01245 [Arthrobacter sp. Leaf141]